MPDRSPGTDLPILRGPVHELDAGSYQAVVRHGVPMIERTTGVGAVLSVDLGPHVFKGRRDRWCLLCNKPDRDPSHVKPVGRIAMAGDLP